MSAVWPSDHRDNYRHCTLYNYDGPWLTFPKILNYWLLKPFFWRRITYEGPLPEMRILSILLIKSDLKWCIHVRRILFLYTYKATGTIWQTLLKWARSWYLSFLIVSRDAIHHFVKLQKYAFLKPNSFMRIDELPYHSSFFYKLFFSMRQLFINIGKYP